MHWLYVLVWWCVCLHALLNKSVYACIGMCKNSICNWLAYHAKMNILHAFSKLNSFSSFGIEPLCFIWHCLLMAVRKLHTNHKNRNGANHRKCCTYIATNTFEKYFKRILPQYTLIYNGLISQMNVSQFEICRRINGQSCQVLQMICAHYYGWFFAT